LDQIAGIVGPILSDLGISYSWDSAVEGETLKCACTLRHSNGYSVSSNFACPTDTRAAMTGAQKFGAALTYARRQSLIQVLGLTTCDPDNDAATEAAMTPINATQAAEIRALIKEVGADPARFLAFMKVKTLEDIRDFSRAMNALHSKRLRGGTA